MSLAALIELLPDVLKLIRLLLSLPAGQRGAYLKRLNSALERAVNEKDPSDLSRLLNELSNSSDPK